MNRNQIMAYLIGAGFAGTYVIFPYLGRIMWSTIYPELLEVYFPFFLLPLIWGTWNLLYLEHNRSHNIGAWGAMLGCILGLTYNLLLYANGHWFKAAIMIPIETTAYYFLLWKFMLGPLNDTFGIER
jgi:hypothetical protein